MYTMIYAIVFGMGLLSLLPVITYQNYKMDRLHWGIILLLQFVNLGYLQLSVSKTLSEALFANTLIYIGGTVLPTVFVFSVFQAFGVRVSRVIKVLVYIISMAILFSVRLGSENGWFYKSVELNITENGTILNITPGIGLYIHDVYVYLLIVALLGCFIFAKRQNKTSSIIITNVYKIIVLLMVVGYALHAKLGLKFEILPEVYIVSLWIATIAYRMSYRYDIDEVVMSRHEKNEVKHGYISFDGKFRFLGATERAYEMIPEIYEYKPLQTVDNQEKMDKIDIIIRDMLDNHKKGANEKKAYRRGDVYYELQIIEHRRKHSGIICYIFEVTDITEQQKYLHVVEKYNNNLQKEVTKQIEHVKSIQEGVVIGLANMVDNRDSNTGGHIKRTSDIIAILVRAMQGHNIENISSRFAEDIIRAAPMHDLGKIEIDTSILMKPGKLTDEEFEIMKQHSVKSGDIVLNILYGVEEEHFVNVAYNVARYHHEKWNGLGYPDGLKGTDIPLEARIMAIADVYDALVSKRCYKEPMSFEEASQVMLDGMGTHFDPMMKRVFLLCRGRMEKYYKETQQ